ncbi:MAG: alpha/beta hydrolase [Victivallaceae bacterium]|nr:alpha/beta hydrolase [Victivallaceae bacterium]
MPKIQRFEEILLWKKNIPFSVPDDAGKKERFLPGDDGIDRLTDVTTPGITFFPVGGKGPHPAVLVAPGGGYQFLAWNHEGLDICSFFNAIGFSAFLLKYRVPDRREAAHADAARAMRIIRSRAVEFDVDPAHIGMLGFSAGAHLTATVAAPAGNAPYPSRDKIDKENFRPDFCALIYPAYLVKKNLALQKEFRIDDRTPPVFLLQAQNDPIQVENALGWFWEMKKCGRPAELHCYASGGHGYGLFRTGEPVSDWGNLAAVWFRRNAGIR